MITLDNLNQTYCNPLPLPDYPRGAASLKKSKAYGWMHPFRVDFRETADPTVIYHEGRWYLYPSCGMGYVTDDFIHWQHRPTTPENIGYAPTVVYFRERFYLTAFGADLWVSAKPLGPFERVGPIQLPDGSPVPPATGWGDPMLFADDDGQLYAYWGCGGSGIKGVRLDPQNPNRMARHRPARCVSP